MSATVDADSSGAGAGAGAGAAGAWNAGTAGGVELVTVVAIVVVVASFDLFAPATHLVWSPGHFPSLLLGFVHKVLSLCTHSTASVSCAPFRSPLHPHTAAFV